MRRWAALGGACVVVAAAAAFFVARPAVASGTARNLVCPTRLYIQSKH